MAPFMEHVITVLVCILCTLIIAPVVVGLFLKKVDKKEFEKEKILVERDEARKEIEQQWHEKFAALIDNLASEVRSALNASSQDRQNIWSRLYNHGHEIECKQSDCHIATKGITVPSGRRD